MQKIIIDTDPGCDDAMAIAFALAHPQIDLLGLTTVFGNVAVNQASQNALTLLNAFGAAHLPVAGGAGEPLLQAPLPFPDFVHGKDGLGNTSLAPAAAAVEKYSAAEFIVQQANSFPGMIKVVTIGPLTNLALALRLDQDLPTKLGGVVIMGGALAEPGNVSPVAEANFLADPHAADMVLGQQWPVVIVGLDVTHRVILTETMLKRLAASAGHTGECLWRISQFYMDFYRSTPIFSAVTERGCCMHDATALVYLVAPEQFALGRGSSRVVTEGIAVGQFTMALDGYSYLLPHWQDRPLVSYCTGINSKDVANIFMNTIATGHLV